MFCILLFYFTSIIHFLLFFLPPSLAISSPLLFTYPGGVISAAGVIN